MFYTERSVTSCYHGSKISGSQQSFLIETASCIDERLNKSTGYRFVPKCNHAQKSHACQFFRVFFPAKFAGPQFVEIQKRITLATWRNDFYSLLPIAGGLELIRNSETFWMNSNNVYMMSKNVVIWGLLSNLRTMHQLCIIYREFPSRFASRTLRETSNEQRKTFQSLKQIQAFEI